MRTGIVHAEIAAGVLYVFGCALSAYAPDMSIMILGRLLQGMGGGGLVSLAFIGASTMFPKNLLGESDCKDFSDMGGFFIVWSIDWWVFR